MLNHAKHNIELSSSSPPLSRQST